MKRAAVVRPVVAHSDVEIDSLWEYRGLPPRTVRIVERLGNVYFMRGIQSGRLSKITLEGLAYAYIKLSSIKVPAAAPTE